MRKLVCIILLATLAFTSVSAADPLPIKRHAAWPYTGVPGGIPKRTAVCATFSPGATCLGYQQAISSCSNGVVALNAGTYSAASLGGSIVLYNSNVTLRGAAGATRRSSRRRDREDGKMERTIVSERRSAARPWEPGSSRWQAREA